MNKIFISGLISGMPVFRMEQGEIPHLILSLCVRHRTDAGKIQKETYRVSAWHNTARWGAEHLRSGQIIGLQGYLAQHRVVIGNIVATETEVAVDEFLAGEVLVEREAHDTVATDSKETVS
ncbi:MAG: single-stranded DNA-binding protein [Candidatus Pararuminococcus gallinarum]|jgi:single-stranded DNA-binding protein